MRIVMIGAGALGGLFAHHMALGGAEVVLVDTWAEHVAAIRERGLRLRIAGEKITSPVRHAVTEAAEAGVADILVLFTKTWASREALRAARPAIGPQTVLVTLQNGIGNPELMAEVCPGHPVLFGLTTLTSDVLAPGLVEPRSTARGMTDVWTLNGDGQAALADFVALLNRGGIAAREAPDIAHSIWKKLVVNCALNGLCALTGTTCGGLTAEAEIWGALDAISDEVSAIARAKGIPLDPEAARAFLRDVNRASLAHHPSMVSDLRERRPTEIGSLNGAVVREGERLGIAAPVNAWVAALVRAVEARNATSHG